MRDRDSEFLSATSMCNKFSLLQENGGGIVPMKFSSVRIALFAASLVLFASLPSFGQTVVSVDFTGGYSATWNSGWYGDVEAGTYTASINGATSAPGIICDDFNDSVTSGETWKATEYQVSSLISSGNLNNTLFGKSIGATGYAEVATLVSLMFGGGTSYAGITGITQAELSSAIWDITTPGGILGLNGTAKALVAAVEAAFGGNTSKADAYLATLTNLFILTPNPKTGVGSGEPQEMWTEGLSAAEGGTALMYLLLASFFCGWAFFVHKRERVRV
jgi:hypothetical protein